MRLKPRRLAAMVLLAIVLATAWSSLTLRAKAQYVPVAYKIFRVDKTGVVFLWLTNSDLGVDASQPLYPVVYRLSDGYWEPAPYDLVYMQYSSGSFIRWGIVVDLGDNPWVMIELYDDPSMMTEIYPGSLASAYWTPSGSQGITFGSCSYTNDTDSQLGVSTLKVSSCTFTVSRSNDTLIVYSISNNENYADAYMVKVLVDDSHYAYVHTSGSYAWSSGTTWHYINRYEACVTDSGSTYCGNAAEWETTVDPVVESIVAFADTSTTTFYAQARYPYGASSASMAYTVGAPLSDTVTVEVSDVETLGIFIFDVPQAHIANPEPSWYEVPEWTDGVINILAITGDVYEEIANQIIVGYMLAGNVEVWCELANATKVMLKHRFILVDPPDQVMLVAFDPNHTVDGATVSCSKIWLRAAIDHDPSYVETPWSDLALYWYWAGEWHNLAGASGDQLTTETLTATVASPDATGAIVVALDAQLQGELSIYAPVSARSPLTGQPDPQDPSYSVWTFAGANASATLMNPDSLTAVWLPNLVILAHYAGPTMEIWYREDVDGLAVGKYNVGDAVLSSNVASGTNTINYFYVVTGAYHTVGGPSEDFYRVDGWKPGIVNLLEITGDLYSLANGKTVEIWCDTSSGDRVLLAQRVVLDDGNRMFILFDPDHAVDGSSVECSQVLVRIADDHSPNYAEMPWGALALYGYWDGAWHNTNGASSGTLTWQTVTAAVDSPPDTNAWVVAHRIYVQSNTYYDSDYYLRLYWGDSYDYMEGTIVSYYNLGTVNWAVLPDSGFMSFSNPASLVLIGYSGDPGELILAQSDSSLGPATTVKWSRSYYGFTLTPLASGATLIVSHTTYARPNTVYEAYWVPAYYVQQSTVEPPQPSQPPAIVLNTTITIGGYVTAQTLRLNVSVALEPQASSRLSLSTVAHVSLLPLQNAWLIQGQSASAANMLAPTVAMAWLYLNDTLAYKYTPDVGWVQAAAFDVPATIPVPSPPAVIRPPLNVPPAGIYSPENLLSFALFIGLWVMLSRAIPWEIAVSISGLVMAVIMTMFDHINASYVYLLLFWAGIALYKARH